MERIIFTLSYEKKWGCWVIFACQAIDAGDFFQSTGRYSGGHPEVPSGVEEIMPLIAKYDAPALFRLFGRKKYKDERDFLAKVDEAYIGEYIRPYIGNLVAAITYKLAADGFPLFLNNSRLDNFYKNRRIFLQSVPLRALLRFERTGEFTRYILRLTDGQKSFYPCDYELKIISRKPCRVLSGRQLFSFPEDFDGQRLQPFLQKREVMIPKVNEQLYFRKFILKNLRHEEIEVQGFDVIVREAAKKAYLSLERDVQGGPLLVLNLRYGAQHIPGWSDRKVLVELHTEGDRYAFYKVNRDAVWERDTVQSLVGLGLKACTTGCFRPEGIEEPGRQGNEETGDRTGEKDPAVEKAWAKTIEWVRLHRRQLKEMDLELVQSNLRRCFYTGDWEMDFSVRETIDWFEIHARVVFEDGRSVPLICFREHLLAGKREFILEDGTVFFIPEEWFADYHDLFLWAGHKGGALYLHRSQFALLNGVEKGVENGNRVIPDVKGELPQGLEAVLRPYQLKGYSWLYRLYAAGLGGCLADDMGLGKTVQVIALLLKYRQETVKALPAWKSFTGGRQLSLFDALPQDSCPESTGQATAFHTCLVVVPASLVHNWRNEIRRFAPRLTVTVYAGNHRQELRPFLQQSDLVIVTYHTLRNDIAYLSQLSFGIVVADEAQMLKNPDSQLHQALLRIQGKHFYALSGTPVENSLTDLWAIMNWINRDMLGSHHFFRKNFIKPLQQDPESPQKYALQKLIAPFVLRRTKEEVLSELPELTTALVMCEPTDEQRKIYEEEQSRVRNYILDKKDTRDSLRNDFMVLKALIRLRQIANHPRLVDGGSTAGSGKFREIMEMLKEVVETGHKVLVFSSFVKYLEMVAGEAAAAGWKYAMLTGGTRGREQEIRRFSTDPECRIFLISLKAGGVGLNLTEADYVFILDPWWNLSAENQAVGRAHRMGQKRAVFVYRFITASTLEEKILKLQQRKQQLVETVIGTAPAIPLSDEEMLEVLGEESL